METMIRVKRVVETKVSPKFFQDPQDYSCVHIHHIYNFIVRVPAAGVVCLILIALFHTFSQGRGLHFLVSRISPVAPFSYIINIKNNENLVYTPHNPWEPKLVKNSCPVLGWPISDYIKIYTQRHGNQLGDIKDFSTLLQQRNLATCPPLCRGREGPLPSSSLPLALDVGGSDPAGEVGGDDGGEENRSGEWPAPQMG